MCAYFFAVKRPAVTEETLDTKEKRLKLQTRVTNPDTLQVLLDANLPDATFSQNTQEHMALITHCTTMVKEKLEDVIAADKEAATFLILGMTATAFLPFGWVISPLALMYSGYMIKEREPAYADYNAALETLKNCAAWALKNDSTINDPTINGNPEITAMLKTLQDVMTYKQLDGIIPDGEAENVFFATKLFEVGLITPENLASLKGTGKAKRPEWLQTAMNTADEAKQKTLKYKMYGYQQGGSLAAITVKMLTFIREAFSSLLVQCMDILRSNTPGTPSGTR